MVLLGIRRLFACALLATVVLAACGGDDDDDDAASDEPSVTTAESEGDGDDEAEDGDESEVGNGCDIVTAADAEAIFGEPAQESAEGTIPAQVLASCIWEVSETSTKLLQFYVWDGAAFYAPEVYEDQPGFEELDGLGDRAFISGTMSVDVNVLDGDRMISLSVSGFGADDPGFDEEALRASMLDLAEKAVDAV